MITKYFANVTVRMPPVGPGAKLARVFLANLPPRNRANIKLDFKLLQPQDTAAPQITVKFKDGTTISVDPRTKRTAEMVEDFDRQSRQMQINDSLKE